MMKIAITDPRRVFLLTILLLLIIVAIVFKISWGTPVILQSGELVVNDGSSAQSVWSKLVQQGYVKRTLPLRYYSWRLAANNNIKSGTYSLTPGEHVSALISRLVAGDVNLDVVTVTFPEGFTLQQVADRTAARGIGTSETFTTTATPDKFKTQFPFLSSVPVGRDLEGYLFPDTYQVYVDDIPADVIKRMLTNFDQKITQGLRDEAARQNRSLDEVIIMASIIEREVISNEDMAAVAGVLWKRYDDGVGLDADATVRYALQKWDAPLTFQDLQTDSPYNTRKWRGLPPGPISNPGLRAIQAAIRPQKSDYYYYLSTPSGQTIFSRTLEEHNINKAKYLR